MQTETQKRVHSIADKVYTEGDEYPLIFAGLNKETDQMEYVINGRPDYVANVLMSLLQAMRPQIEYVPANQESMN